MGAVVKKKKKIRSMKGFSLVELLAVIIIVGVISVLAISGVTRYMDRSRKEKINQNKKNVAMSAQLYLQANRQLLPKMIGEATTIPFSDLRKANYLKEDVTNDKGEDCMDKSFVRVYMLDEDEYSYTSYLYCGDDVVPDEIPVPKPYMVSFDFLGGTNKNKKMNEVKDSKFTFKVKGSEDDDTVGIYSYTYSIFVRSNAGEPFTEVFNSGVLKGGLEPTIEVMSQPLQSYISLTGYTNVRVDVVVINEQGGKLEYKKESGEYEDKEKPICGSTQGEAKDDNDWVNKESYGADGNILNGQLRAYPGRVSVNCSDGSGSGCKRDKFTRSWPNNSKAVSEIGNYKFGARWSYVELEDNAQVANTIKCYVRANVDVKAPTVTVHVKRTKDNKEVSTLTVQDTNVINAIMPEGTIASDKHADVQGTGTEKWMNLGKYGTGGIYIDVDVSDNLYLYSYDWKVNEPYLPGGSNDAAIKAHVNDTYAKEEGTSKTSGTFASPGLTDNPTNDNELKTAEHGSLSDSIAGLKINKEGKRYGVLKVCDKAKNCTTVHIYANIDYTAPLVPKTSYERIKTKTNYTPATRNDYTDHNHWSNEYVRPYVDGQRDDKETQNPNKKVELSGWDQFKYSYERQRGKNNGVYDWFDAVVRDIHTAAGNSGKYGFDITDEGTHIVKFQSCDRAGNCSKFSVDDYVKVDTINPTCDIVTKYAGTDANKITGEVKNKAIGSSNGSGWLKIGQQVTLSHSCEDKDNQFSSGCNETDAHNKQSYLYNSDINTNNAGANGYNTTYKAGDNTAGGHVVDYAGNMSAECPKMTVKIDHVAPKCKTAISWPEGKPTNPEDASKPETGWLGLVKGVGDAGKTAKVSQVCTDPPSTSGHMKGVLSDCDNAGTYDSHKYNQQFHIYGTEMSVTNAGSVDVGKSGKVIDNAGNTADCPADRTVKIDYHKPVCTTKIDYGTGSGAGSYSKTSKGNPKNGWLGWYTDTDTTKKMARITQVCNDSEGPQKSGCYGKMKFKVYDTEMNRDDAGAVGIKDNGYIYDKAMNQTDCSTPGNFHTVKIDYTRPECKVDISSKGSYKDADKETHSWVHTDYDGSWLGQKSVVTIHSTCTSKENGKKNSSGCDTDKSKNYKDEISTTKATTAGDGKDFFVYDKAGNRAYKGCDKKQVRIDHTGPVCTTETRAAKTKDGVTNDSPPYDANAKNDKDGWLRGTYTVRVISWCSDDKQSNGLAGSGCTSATKKKKANNYSIAKDQVFNKLRGALKDGSSYIVKDIVGNTRECTKKRIKLDYQNPTCPISMKTNTGATYKNDSWTNADSVTVTRKCNDGSGSGCKDKATTTYSGSCTVSSSITASHTYNAKAGGLRIYNGNAGADGKSCRAKVYDLVGNSIVCESNKTIKFDQEPPRCPITKESYVNGKWTKEDAVVEATCSDGKGSGCVKKTFRERIDYDYNGSFAFRNHIAKDVAGNQTRCDEKTYTIRVQKTLPRCAFSYKASTQCSAEVEADLYCYRADSPSPSAKLTQCGRLSGNHTGLGPTYGVSSKNVTAYVKDEAGNSVSCTTKVYPRSQNRHKTCSACKSGRCSGNCLSSETVYCAGYKFKGDCDSGGECWSKSSCPTTSGTQRTNCKYACGTKCTSWDTSCAKCGCKSGKLSGWSDWYFGSHSAGWDGNTYYGQKTVYCF